MNGLIKSDSSSEVQEKAATPGPGAARGDKHAGGKTLNDVIKVVPVEANKNIRSTQNGNTPH